jgi:hypothetical protein
MAIPVHDDSELKPGDFFEDCSYHPCLCVRSQDGQVDGISLVDGSFPRNCGIPACGIRKLTAEEAITWRLHGPQQRPPEYDATMLPPTTNAPDWWRKDAEFAVGRGLSDFQTFLRTFARDRYGVNDDVRAGAYAS